MQRHSVKNKIYYRFYRLSVMEQGGFILHWKSAEYYFFQELYFL